MKFNWSIRKLALAALLCMVIGLVGVVVLIGSARENSISAPYEMEKSFDIAQVSAVSVATDVTDVAFVKGSGSEVKVRLAGSITAREKESLTVDTAVTGDNTLNIEVRFKGSFNVGIDVNELISLFKNGFHSSLKLEVALPEKLYRSVKFKSSTGDAVFHALTAEQLTISTDTGDVTLDGFEGSQLRIDTDTGDLRLQHVKAQVALDTATGDVKLSLDELRKSVDIDTDTGDVDILLAQAVPVRLDFGSDTGRTKATIPGQVIHYDLKEKHRLKGSFGGTEGPLVKVKSDTGDISFEVK